MGFLIKMFGSFQHFNKEFEKEFKYFKFKYPLTFYVFNKELRTFFEGGVSNDHVTTWKCVVIWILQPLYRWYILLRVSLTAPNYLYDLRWNKRLESSFLEHCRRLLDAPNVLGIKPRLLGFCPFVYKDFHRILGSALLQNLDEISPQLGNIEMRLEHQRKRLLDVFRVCNAKALLLGGHSSAASALLVMVAEQCGVHTISFAHGMVQNPKLMTVYPLYCSSFVVWSEGQRVSISNQLDLSDARKLVYCGTVSPIDGRRKRNVLDQNIVVVILPPLSKLRQFGESPAMLTKLLSQLTRYNLIFRWHPRDSKRDVLLWFSGFSTENTGKIVLSRNDSLLLSARAVLSFGSTLLYQLKEAGYYCAQISNDFFPRIEGVDQISLELLSDSRLSELGSRPRPAGRSPRFSWDALMASVEG